MEYSKDAHKIDKMSSTGSLEKINVNESLDFMQTIRDGLEPLDILKSSFEYIMKNLSAGLSIDNYIYLYTLVYEYCTNQTNCLYTTVSPDANDKSPGVASPHSWIIFKELKSYLYVHLNSVASKLSSKSSVELLETLVENWDRYTTAASIISNVMAYVNRHWAGRQLLDNQPVHNTYTLSLILWKEIIILKSARLRSNIINTVLDLIELEREGIENHHLLIKNVLDTFVSASIETFECFKKYPETYRLYFEVPFLNRTVEYYTNKSKDIIEKNSVIDYIHKVESMFDDERSRMNAYLYRTSHEPLLLTLEHVLIENHSNEIELEFSSLIKKGDPNEVRMTHKLLTCVPHSLKRLTFLFEEYVRNEGMEYLDKIAKQYSQHSSSQNTSIQNDLKLNDPSVTSNTPENNKIGSVNVPPTVYFNTIVKLHKKLSTIVREAFDNDYGFTSSMDKAFVEFINHNSACHNSPKKNVELLVKYADGILRKDNERFLTKNEDILENLKFFITLFKYVKNKDFFQKLYQNMLAKRLIYRVYASKELEENVINMLKHACGSEYSGKLSRMFADAFASAEHCTSFKEEYMPTNHPDFKLFDFRFIIAGAHWPLVPSHATPKLPLELLNLSDCFNDFYTKKFTGRKLNWLLNFGKSELKANCFQNQNSAVTLVLSNYQIIILMLYNVKLVYTWDEIVEQTNIKEEQLAIQINSLVNAKILEVIYDKNSSTPNDLKLASYRLNLKHEFKSSRIKTYHQSHKENIIDLETSQKSPESNDSLILQAAIIRSIKGSPPMSQDELVTRTINSLKGRVELTEKIVIDEINYLVQREFLSRASENSNIIRYIA